MSLETLTEIEVPIDLDALWATMKPKLERRGVTGDALFRAEGLFWKALEETDDWIEFALGESLLDLRPVLAVSFERRFIAQAVKAAGLPVVRAA